MILFTISAAEREASSSSTSLPSVPITLSGFLEFLPAGRRLEREWISLEAIQKRFMKS